MKAFKYIFLVACLSLMAFTTLKTTEATQKYKCMVQLKNYQGEGAYVIVSLVDKNGKYLKTLQVLGDDTKWYADITSWWSFFEPKEKTTNIDAITGATIAGGERAVFVIEVNQNDINKGNKIRFETSVEQQEYHIKDLEIALDSEMQKKYEGTGYIRYVRIMPN
ncbi:DUF2271 domain-containing protein [Wenyingzhuangia sp. IMCC45467]